MAASRYKNLRLEGASRIEHVENGIDCENGTGRENAIDCENGTGREDAIDCGEETGPENGIDPGWYRAKKGREASVVGQTAFSASAWTMNARSST